MHIALVLNTESPSLKEVMCRCGPEIELQLFRPQKKHQPLHMTCHKIQQVFPQKSTIVTVIAYKGNLPFFFFLHM